MSYNSSVGAYSRACESVYISHMAVRLSFFFPLSIFILGLAFHQRKQQRSFNSWSHFDIFTFNVVVLELIYSVGIMFNILWYNLYLNVFYMVSNVCMMMNVIGEVFFNVLACVERYVAVVHPVTYRKLKNARGVGIRNALIVCVWILTILCSSFHLWAPHHLSLIPVFCILVPSLLIVSVTSFSVLCVLLRPGPGKVGGAREWVDQSKKRAFFTMMIIMVVLWVGFLGMLGPVAAYQFTFLDELDICLVTASGLWFHMPISLVLPMLYLHRMGKLACCCQRKSQT